MESLRDARLVSVLVAACVALVPAGLGAGGSVSVAPECEDDPTCSAARRDGGGTDGDGSLPTGDATDQPATDAGARDGEASDGPSTDAPLADAAPDATVGCPSSWTPRDNDCVLTDALGSVAALVLV